MRSVILLLAFCLAACATPSRAPVVWPSPFTGEGSGLEEGAGMLQLRNSDGIQCSGRWEKISEGRASAEVSCTNSRSGVFTFDLSGRHASYGQGILLGQQVLINLTR